VERAHILIVEDDPTCRQMLAAVLTESGLDVASAAGGEEAMRFLYSEEACDVVLCDIVMPWMSGIELSRLVKDCRPGLPVILMSGEADAIERVTESGSLALAKPFSCDRLISILSDALDLQGNTVRSGTKPRPEYLREGSP